MIDIKKILKRSWQILWSYRILWVFGILLALTAGGNMSGSNSSWRSQASQNTPGGFSGVNPESVIPAGAPQWVRQLVEWFVKDVEPLFTHPEQHIRTFVAIGVVLFLVIMVFSILAAFVRYPAETAVMRMVDGYETDGTKMGFRQGWKLGWNRRAFRLWVIDLILSIPVFILILLIIGAGGLVFFSMSSTFQVTNTTGIVFAIGLGFLSLFLLVVMAVLLTLLRNFFARAAALVGLDVKASLKYGWGMFKRNWKSAGLMLLVMVGIGIVFGIAGLILFFLLIPAYVVLLIPAALAASLPALIAYGITSLFTSGPLAWIITILAAIPLFFTVLFAPLFLFGGWFKIFESNVWTLTYREIKAVESLVAPELPAEGAKTTKK
jgi:hypothetical protein